VVEFPVADGGERTDGRHVAHPTSFDPSVQRSKDRSANPVQATFLMHAGTAAIESASATGMALVGRRAGSGHGRQGPPLLGSMSSSGRRSPVAASTLAGELQRARTPRWWLARQAPLTTVRGRSPVAPRAFAPNPPWSRGPRGTAWARLGRSALEVATGKVTDACYERHTNTEFLAFLKLVAKAYPRRELHVVCDNYATHVCPESGVMTM